MKIIFEEGSSQISDEDFGFLSAIAKNISSNQGFIVSVISRISSTTKTDESDRLLVNRMNTVVETLKSFGVPESLIDCETWKDDSTLSDYVQLFVLKQ